MKKIVLLYLGLLGSWMPSMAQTKDTTSHAGVHHLVGLQANALFRQLFNLNGNTIPTNNPYLLTYTLLSGKKGWGVDVGLGYTYNKSFETDGNTKKDNFINDLYFRIGPQKSIPLNKRFVTQISVHILYDMLNSDTKTESNFGGQISRITTKTSILRYGAGPALGLRYRLSPRIWIGTEASYYFRMGKQKSDMKSTTEFQGQIITDQSSNSNNDITQFVFNPPAVLFLQLRF